MTAALRLWVDTDVGDNPDDAVALLLAARLPAVELVGVSTVRGDVGLRAELARALLRDEGVDPFVYAGPPDPRALATAEALLAIGPLTNLGALVERGVPLPPVAAMAGALRPVHHRGARRTVETNLGSDPPAGAVVVGRVGDLLVVPLDVTARMLLDADELARLLAAAPTLRPSVERWLLWLDGEGVTGRHQAVCLHDPLALLALLGEHVAVERRRLAVESDGRLVEAPAGPWHDVVVDVERDAAVDRICGVLEAAPPRGAGATSAKGD